jgi:CRISPR/Cas system CMR subunit Cmr4 (Cas7 group RAMP superfamily)
VITFTIRFHGPFHVGTGNPDDGLDRPVDRSNLLPATSLKGLLRAEATEVLGIDGALVDRVFGARGKPGAWWWEDARPDGFLDVRRMARIVVGDNGIVSRGFLMLGEHVWLERATFQVGPLRQLEPADQELHMRVLRAAARSCMSLGGSRRRGEGWVSITDDQSVWTVDDSRAIVASRGAR